MGSDKNTDKQAYDDEQPRHEVTLPDYYLARYPVTNAQFSEFVRLGGYAEPRYWPEAEAAEVWKDGAVQAWNDAEPRRAPYDYGQPFNLPNHPVVGVTWYEALAYCRWLGEKLSEISAQQSAQLGLRPGEQTFSQGLADGGLVVSLPSEAEWEKAARGALPSPGAGPGLGTLPSPGTRERPGVRAYPWGDDFDPDKANTAETGLGVTSPAGCFPLGASLYGLLDLSGNTWEWTRSLWVDYPYPDEPGARRKREDLATSSPRVWRGGSFIYSQWRARCAVRGRYFPYLRNHFLGFRAGVSPLSLGSGRSGTLGL